jgi:pyridoxine 5-phosphate synthase
MDIKLGVNIDHTATIRQARATDEPDPIWAAAIAQLAGADIITVHLREDRRHINDRDVRLLKETVSSPLNLEMSLAEEIVEIALKIQPDEATFVPERRQEVTTEGGLDVAGEASRVKAVVARLKEAGIRVSLFIDAEEKQIRAAKDAGADAVELHTGKYAEAENEPELEAELEKLRQGAELAHSLGLEVHAGHGLTYRNVKPITTLPHLTELHIGHSIISRAVLAGLDQAVREMKGFME